MKKLIAFVLISSLSLISIQANKTVKYNYWFDQERQKESVVTYETTESLSFAITTSDLADGIHQLYFRVQDSIGYWSPLYSHLFFVNSLPKNDEIRIDKVEYWLDNNWNEVKTEAISGEQYSFSLDASVLSDGLHTLYYRAKDNEGHYSPTSSWLFFKGSVSDSTRKVVEGEYWIDDKYDDIKKMSVDKEQTSLSIDASSVSEGLHTLSYRFKDSHGLYSPLQTWLFLRNELKDTALINIAETIEYWYDGDVSTLKTESVNNGIVDVKIETSSLSVGLHTLSFRAKDVLGDYSNTHTWAFIKNEPTPLKISWYKYWWNNNIEQATIVNIETESPNYVFEQELIVPDYARNDGFSTNSTARFNIVFCDDMGHPSNIEWADVSYPDVIPPISTIVSDKEQSNESIVLSWSANEDYIQDYNIYYSEDDKPFVLWLPNTISQTATFKGQIGKIYRFTVTARDQAGNREKLNEEKCITVKFVDAF